MQYNACCCQYHFSLFIFKLHENWSIVLIWLECSNSCRHRTRRNYFSKIEFTVYECEYITPRGREQKQSDDVTNAIHLEPMRCFDMKEEKQFIASACANRCVRWETVCYVLKCKYLITFATVSIQFQRHYKHSIQQYAAHVNIPIPIINLTIMFALQCVLHEETSPSLLLSFNFSVYLHLSSTLTRQRDFKHDDSYALILSFVRK